MIFGATGTGKTTLAYEFAKRTGFEHIDSDDYYWKKTNPPFQEKIPLTERNEKLKIDFHKYENVVVSGSMISWGEEWKTAFDLAVFMILENTKRLERLKKRENERYGEKLLTDKKIQKISMEYLDWANQYENLNFDGTTIKIHTNWIEQIECKVLTLNGECEPNQNVEKILTEIKTTGNNGYNSLWFCATPK